MNENAVAKVDTSSHRSSIFIRWFRLGLVQVVILAACVGGMWAYAGSYLWAIDGREVKLNSDPEYDLHWFSIFIGVGTGDHSATVKYAAVFSERDNWYTHDLTIGETAELPGWGSLTLIDVNPVRPSEAGRLPDGGGSARFVYRAPGPVWVSWAAVAVAIGGFILCLWRMRRQRTLPTTVTDRQRFRQRLTASVFMWFTLGAIANVVGLPRLIPVLPVARVIACLLAVVVLAGLFLLPRPKRFARLYQRILWFALGLSFIAMAPNPVTVVAGVVVGLVPTSGIHISQSTRTPLIKCMRRHRVSNTLKFRHFLTGQVSLEITRVLPKVLPKQQPESGPQVPPFSLRARCLRLDSRRAQPRA